MAKGTIDDQCIKTNKKVLVRDCEDCLSKREGSPLCLKRGFVWGRPDISKPLWEFIIILRHPYNHLKEN